MRILDDALRLSLRSIQQQVQNHSQRPRPQGGEATWLKKLFSLEMMLSIDFICQALQVDKHMHTHS